MTPEQLEIDRIGCARMHTVNRLLHEIAMDERIPRNQRASDLFTIHRHVGAVLDTEFADLFKTPDPKP